MRGASFRDMAGADVKVADIERMLGLDETLFVEHKGAEPDRQLAKAVASFANQLGGWVILNVNKGKPIGPLPDWIVKAASPVDAVRDRLGPLVDPMPPFEARTFDLGDDKAVLMIRVYESADTPHILSDGAIYVRGVAQDKRPDPIYRPAPIENQQALRALVERGEQSRARVADLLKPRNDIPLGNSGIGVQFARAVGGLVPHSGSPLMSVRLAPHTLSGRFQGWARSAAALALGQEAMTDLTGSDQIEVHPHSQGFWLQARMGDDRAPKTEVGLSLAGPARLAVDAVGLVGASTAFAQRDDQDWCPPLTVKGFGDLYVAPLIAAPAQVLERGAVLGRATCHIWMYGMGNLMRIEDEGGMARGAGQVPFEGDITLPIQEGEIAALAGEAARAFGREGGLLSSFEQ
ncbi:MAG TPA: ATP-binding protein [Solirubrobacterales bacterium]|nr:ATP-binding protein [Solirubrobacterales bacterium]